MFIPYQDVERLGNSEVEGILNGKCYIFPKLDGTCSSLWYNNGIQAGSRRRQLSIHSDNRGFYKSTSTNIRFMKLFKEYPNLMLYGEWLVLHTIKDYLDSAWGKFYVFDILKVGASTLTYLPYILYEDILVKFGIDFIPCIGVLVDPTIDDVKKYLDKNTYLMKKGYGEGIVIKNYDFVNRYGRTTWAKLVRDEYSHENRRKKKKVDKSFVEEMIVEKFVSRHLIDKVYAKICSDNGGWSSKFTQQLLNTIFYDLVREESWNMVKKFKYPTINYKVLKAVTFSRIKVIKKELF